MPPPVDPAHAPMNISTTIMSFESVGHVSKSVVANPVVVITVATWKKACLAASADPPVTLSMFKVIVTVEMRMIAR